MKNNSSPKKAADFGLPLYFDMQAKLGHTKHIGGLTATKKLAELCHLGPGKTLLNVGSGSGIAAGFVVETYGCEVVGIDLLEGMVESANRWAFERGLNDRMEFRQGDAQELPFENDQFDAVICESVNVFVPDKEKAMSEYVRVVKPGGFIGITEAIWVAEPSKKVAEIIIEATGQHLQPPEVWETLMEGSGLVDLYSENHQLTIRGETSNQSGLLRNWTYMRIVGRIFKLLLTDKDTRSLLKYMSSNPRGYFKYMGYGIYVGMVPR